MQTDADLLQRYVKARDQRAFAELVERHLQLVYSAALRRTNGRTHVAEEIAQKVFTDLSRKAASLQHHPALTGWLHRSTRYVAIDTARRETRYRNLTQSYHAMTDPAPQPEPHIAWENLRPVIDEALDDLKQADREVMLLRYFDGLSFAKVGARMNLSENTARMRTERALVKLRAQLGKRGISSTGKALGLLLANHTLAIVPASLASHVTTAALAVAPAGTIGSLLSMLASHKVAAVLIGAGLLGGIAGVMGSLTKAKVGLSELAVLQSENFRLSRTIAAWGIESSIDTAIPELAVAANSAEPRIEAPETVNNPLNKSDHRNRGQATVENAFLSYAWATDTGNADALAKLMFFDEAGREELEGIYARTPASIRARFRTPKELVVHTVLVAAVLKPPPGPEVLLRKFTAVEVDPDRMIFRPVKSGGKDWNFVQTKAGWKVCFPIKLGLDSEEFNTQLKTRLNNEILVQLGIN